MGTASGLRSVKSEHVQGTHHDSDGQPRTVNRLDLEAFDIADLHPWRVLTAGVVISSKSKLKCYYTRATDMKSYWLNGDHLYVVSLSPVVRPAWRKLLSTCSHLIGFHNNPLSTVHSPLARMPAHLRKAQVLNNHDQFPQPQRRLRRSHVGSSTTDSGNITV